MKREREEFIFYKFKNCYKDFPAGEVDNENIDRPDFIIKGEKKIGIEITEVYQDSYRKYSKMKQKSSDRNNFSILLVDMLQRNVTFKFEVSIQFNEHEYIKKREVNTILGSLYEVIYKDFIELRNNSEIICEDFKLLPKEINSIRILRFDELDESYHNNNDGGSIGVLNNIHIESILLKKEKALLKYKKCDEQWLLISQGDGYPGYFAEIDIEISLESSFDKILLFKLVESEVIELK